MIAIGFDCSEDIWRMVVLRMAGARREVLFAGSLAAHEREAGAEGSALAAWLRAAGGGNSRVAVSLPTSGCAFKTASLPPGKPSEIEQVIRFEAENQFPLPLPELIWGYALADEPSGRRHAVIAGARRGVVEERVTLCQMAGVTPTLILPAAIAAAATLERDDSIHAVVHAGAAWSDLCLYAGARLLSCRSVSAGNPADTGWAESIARELRPWMVTYYGMTQILILGLANESLARRLTQATAGIPVRVGDPWQAIEDPRSLLPSLEEPPAVFATAIGLAESIFSAHAGINLLPGEIHEAAKQRRTTLGTITVLVALILLLMPVLMLGYLSQRVRQVEAAFLQREVTISKAPPAQAQQAITTLLPSVKAGGNQGDVLMLMDLAAHLTHLQVAGAAMSPDALTVAKHPAEVNAAADILRSVKSPDGHPLDLLSILSSKLPAGVTLTDFSYTREKSIILLGNAKSNTLVATAVLALDQSKAPDQSKLFDNVMLNYSNQVSDANAVVNPNAGNSTAKLQSAVARGFDFQITCTLPAGNDLTLGNGKKTRTTPQGTVNQ